MVILIPNEINETFYLLHIIHLLLSLSPFPYYIHISNGIMYTNRIMLWIIHERNDFMIPNNFHPHICINYAKCMHFLNTCILENK